MRISRTVNVKPSGRFVMAIADLGYQTVAARLPGRDIVASTSVHTVDWRARHGVVERWDLRLKLLQAD